MYSLQNCLSYDDLLRQDVVAEGGLKCQRRAASLLSVDALVRVGDVEEEVFLVVLLVEAAHGGRGGRDHVVDEEEEGVFGAEGDALADQEVELAHRQVGGNLRNKDHHNLLETLHNL